MLATASSDGFATGVRRFRATPAVAQLPGLDDGEPGEGGVDPDEGEPQRRRSMKRERLGRPFLDPRAPRRIEEVRAAPIHVAWGGMIDVLEHAAYCNGQREEDPDGFFFDFTVPEFDDEADGDPFANGYLTEDEMEWPEEYEPEAPVPRRVVDQLYFLHTVRGYPVQALCTKYRLSSERVSAIINLKRTEPEMIATERYHAEADELLTQLYAGSDAANVRSDNWAPDFDMGVNYNVMPDEQMPDDAYPVVRRSGALLRAGHTLPRLPTPPRTERRMKSKFVFRDISGARSNSATGRAQLVSDWNGALRPASNMEALYRSWETRYWGAGRIRGKSGFPFADEDAHRPASYRMPP